MEIIVVNVVKKRPRLQPLPDTPPPARKRKEAGKTLTKRGFLSRKTTVNEGVICGEVPGKKIQQDKDNFKR